MQTQAEPSSQRIVEPTLDDESTASRKSELEEANITVNAESSPASSTTDDTTKTELPAKFQGKTVEEIVEAYNNLESRFGKQGNDLGELRQLTDKYVLQNIAAQNAKILAEAENSEESIDEDDFLINPKETIEKLVQQKVKPLEEQLESRKREQAIRALEAKHPDMAEIVQNEQFQAWILASPAREANWGKAANGDFIQADDLFSTYKELTKEKTVVETEDPTEQLGTNTLVSPNELETATAMSTGTSSDAASDGLSKAPTFSRRRLVALQVEDPDKYAALGPEITRAYEEGRVVD